MVYLTYRRSVLVFVCLCLSIAFFDCHQIFATAKSEIARFDVPGGKAKKTLKQAAQQAGLEIFFSASDVRGVNTLPIQGEFVPFEAFNLMLSDTSLAVFQHEKSGVYTIRKAEIAENAKNDSTPEKPTPMNEKEKTTNGLIKGLLALAVAISPNLSAQDDSSSEDKIYELSPFTVTTEGDNGYYATSSMAGSRLNTQLRDIASSIQVVTKEFMEDIGATDLSTVMQYTTAGETGGALGNYVGFATPAGDQTSTAGARANVGNVQRIRGLGNPDKTRGFYKTLIPFDSYNTDRVDINRGANSFLFGLGSPAGLVNANPRQAYHNKDSGEFRFDFDEEGSTRFSFDYNKVLLEDKLAVRLSLLDRDTEYRQAPTFYSDQRAYGALTYSPTSNTTIRASFEKGKIEANPYDTLLPQEHLSGFLYGGPDGAVARASVDVIDNVRQYGNSEGALNGVNGNNALRNFNAPPEAYFLIWDGTGSNGGPAYARVNGIRGGTARQPDPNPFLNLQDDGSFRTRRPWLNYVKHGNIKDMVPNNTGWIQQGFINLDTYDFSRQNLSGNNDHVERHFDAYNISMEQVLWEGKAGFELAFDRQEYEQENWIAFHAGAEQVFLDINETLLYSDLNGDGFSPAPNPNYGRPAIMTQTWSPRSVTDQDVFRFTGFAKHDFRENNEGWLGKLLGRHRLTALADEVETYNKNVEYKMASFLDPAVPDDLSTNGNNVATNYNRSMFRMVYVGPPQLDAFTDPNFDMSKFQLTQVSENLALNDDFTLPVNYWNVENSDWAGGTLAPRWVPANNQSLSDSSLSSIAFNLQSHLWNDLLVVNTGWREDTLNERERVNDAPLVGDVRQVDDASWNLDDTAEEELAQSVFNWGAVLNWPEQWVKLPDGIDFTFHYNESENFSPASAQEDLYANALPLPTGTSKDYGFTLYLAEGKLVARVNWFEGALQNTGNYWRQVNGIVSETISHFGNLTQEIIEVDADGDRTLDAEVDPETNRSQEFLVQAYQARDFLDPLLTPAIREHFSFVQDPVDGTHSNAWAGGTTTDKHDNTTKGMEIELTANPTPNWRIALNVSEYETTLSNVAPRLTEFVETVVEPYIEQYGHLGFDAPTRTDIETFEQGIGNDRLWPFYVDKAQEGSPTSEQRKWNWNLVTNYQFKEGGLKGFNLGGAYRWQDKYALGYPIVQDEFGSLIPDINNPFWGDTEASVDAWFGYAKKIMNDKVDWRIRLNLRNVHNWDSRDISVARVQPDGSAARAKLDAPRNITLSNTFRF